jgi:hypothetical protein
MLEKKNYPTHYKLRHIDLVISHYNVCAYVQTLQQSNRSHNFNVSRKNIDSLGQL